MTCALTIAACALLCCLEAYRRDLSGRKSHILYGGDEHELHDVQERLGQVGYLMTGLGLYAALLPLWGAWWQVLAACVPAGLAAYGAALWGGYWFQVRINRAHDRPDMDPREAPIWYSPRSGRAKIKGHWHGTRRRYQRQVGALCVLVAAGLVALIYWQPWA